MILLVGDIHATPEELGDCEKLIDLICETLDSHGDIAAVTFLGDQYNTFNVVRTEVMDFWIRSFDRIRNHKNSPHVIALVGNHDYAGEGLKIHSMSAHQDAITVIDRYDIWNSDKILVLPYMSDKDEFIRMCRENSEMTTVVCHQSFNGGTYENGMYIPDGIDPLEIPQDRIISGHIHMPQSFGKVTYIGAPRWRSIKDANTERHLWSLSAYGVLAPLVSTGTHCRQIRFHLDTPNDPISLPLDDSVDWRIDIRGPSDWIEKRRGLLAGKGVRLRTFKEDAIVAKVKESEGVDLAFYKYVGCFKPRYGTSMEVLKTMVTDRIKV